MIIKQLPIQLANTLPVLRQINQAGFEAYFVGGCVRDTILGRHLHDVDLATSAYPQEIKQIFSQTIDTGIEHGTVTVIYQHHTYEITTFRTESGYQDFRRPDSVEFVRSLEEDLQRRDFTINALAMNSAGEIIDLFTGLADLQHQRIKAVGVASERFHEDALRMLRAVRFQSQLDFSIEEQTLLGIKANAKLLQYIAVERIREEFIKLMEGINRQAGLQTLFNTKLYQFCPGLANCDFQQLLDYSTGKIDDEATIWSLIGYLESFDKKQLHQFLHHWKIANSTIKLAQTAVQLLLNVNRNSWDLYLAGEKAVNVAAKVLNLVEQSHLSQLMLSAYAALPLKSVHELAINGQQVMAVLKLSPGPKIGYYLQYIQKAIIAGNLQNNYQEIVNFLKTNELEFK